MKRIGPSRQKPAPAETTPPQVFFNRREILAALAATAVSANGACTTSGDSRATRPAISRPDIFPAARNSQFTIPDSVFQEVTPRETAGKHNNFYEFIPDRAGEVWKLTDDFQVEPWTLEVTGACAEPMSLSLDDLFGFQQEERLYHFRCVERWAMNVPWTGFQLSRLLDRARPLPEARFVRFVSAHRPAQMPGIAQASHYPWPYHEALRLDEAMHPLALMATGIYGNPLPKGHGAPVRLVVPWKYGYKSAKSVVRIELLTDEPSTFWSAAFPHEYGFLSNVNPNIPHPRWSQELSFTLRLHPTWPTVRDTFPTPLFNGYEEDVGRLYPDEPREPQAPLTAGQMAR